MHRLRQWLICAKCNKPIEKIVRWNDIENRRVVFKVLCHGEEEITPLQDIDLMCAKRVTCFKAFRDTFCAAGKAPAP